MMLAGYDSQSVSELGLVEVIQTSFSVLSAESFAANYRIFSEEAISLGPAWIQVPVRAARGLGQESGDWSDA